MTSNAPTSRPRRRQCRVARRRRAVSIVLGTLTTVLLVSAASLLGGTTFFPEETERVIGQAKVTAQQFFAPEVVTVTVNGEGGEADLDRAAPGEFVEMVGYRIDGVPPVYAAHNFSGGDVVLGWQFGQHVDVHDAVTGVTTSYVFVDERTTRKWGYVSVEEIVGLRGAIALQSCVYGVDQMRFVGLIPVAEWNLEQAAV